MLSCLLSFQSLHGAPRVESNQSTVQLEVTSYHDVSKFSTIATFEVLHNLLNVRLEFVRFMYCTLKIVELDCC